MKTLTPALLFVVCASYCHADCPGDVSSLVHAQTASLTAAPAPYNGPWLYLRKFNVAGANNPAVKNELYGGDGLVIWTDGAVGLNFWFSGQLNFDGPSWNLLKSWLIDAWTNQGVITQTDATATYLVEYGGFHPVTGAPLVLSQFTTAGQGYKNPSQFTDKLIQLGSEVLGRF